jgi:hypothetical protein
VGVHHAFAPSFRRGMPTEAELQEIAGTSLKISRLNRTIEGGAPPSKMEFGDPRISLNDDLLRPDRGQRAPVARHEVGAGADRQWTLRT